MSTRRTPESTTQRLAAHAGFVVHDARRARAWTLRDLADRAGIAPSSLHAVEHGRPATLQTYCAIALALDLDLRLDLVDPRRLAPSNRAQDPVHAAMGELEARRFAGRGHEVAMDEPFQHYQFAGRADLVAWDRASRSLLHIENRTRFPNVQEALGAYNVKRSYLPDVLAQRLGIRGGFVRVTHVIVGLWSAEVIHVVRIRSATFQAVCPDPVDAFAAWWDGAPATGPVGTRSTFVLLDPVALPEGRRATFIGLDDALRPTTRSRYSGYAAAVGALALEPTRGAAGRS